MEHVLIVERDAALAALLADCIRAAGWRADTTPCLEAAAAASPRASTLVLVDLADAADVEQLSRLCGRDDPPLAVAMAPRDRLDLAIAALRGGACEFLAKPFGMRALERTLAAAACRRRRGSAAPFAVAAEDPPMHELLARAAAAARIDATVAIVGENATGRRRVARFVHATSARGGGPLVELDARALGEQEAIADLCGGEGGDGGALRRAAGGSLLLLEPGALAAAAQARLLAALTTPAGAAPAPRVLAVAERPLRDDPRLCAALRLRLEVVSLRVPPLRERPRELARLAGALGERMAAAQGVPPPRFGPAALAALAAHPFAGNLRELENLVQRAVLCFPGAEVDVPALLGARSGLRPPAPPTPVLDLRELERRTVVQALALHGGNRTRAARALGISVRTLRNKLDRYRLA